MKLKILTLKFSQSANGFDDKPLQDFIADKEVIDFTEYFFRHEKTPYLTLLVSYRLVAADEKKRPERRSDPRQDLDEVEKQAYDALRAWRATRARQEGIPPYMIANNKQLARMVKLRAANKSTLGKIEGIGEAKIANYGEEICQVIAQHLTTEAIDISKKGKESQK